MNSLEFLPIEVVDRVRQVRQGNWSDATEMLGEANPFRDLEQDRAAVPDIDGGIKVTLVV